MDALLAPETLRYIASEGEAPPPPHVRIHVQRKGDRVFLRLNGVTLIVLDSGRYFCAPLRFDSLKAGAFYGVWTTANVFDLQFVVDTVDNMQSIPVGLTVDVCMKNAFQNDSVSIPELQCCGVLLSRNTLRLLLPSGARVKAVIRNPHFALHATHESVAEMRTELLPRIPFCANKCELHISVNVEQHQTVCQYFSVLMYGGWQQAFKALCNHNQSTQEAPTPSQQAEECLVSL